MINSKNNYKKMHSISSYECGIYLFKLIMGFEFKSHIFIWKSHEPPHLNPTTNQDTSANNILRVNPIYFRTIIKVY